ncbi:FRG domain protein [Janthinobacterium sp. MP5059B]|uniref:FRG domain-containing protein n=1 Tax=Janthinobacterium sp. MP5059B TaxID=1766683 RepID=UPI0008936E05|nr:FRG domain-containing protein [Janthinobacterium sp. MP5059B]OEZ48012.1 FRG domain protein [Janthinobacterium sp. MP5059B]
MGKPKEVHVDSLTAFTKQIETLLNKASLAHGAGAYDGNWYRGVGAANSHSLGPTLYRHPKTVDITQLLILERRMMEDFERQNVLHTAASATAVSHNDLRTLFYMQHYQVPTRLLDWSSNPFISLYFALSSARIDEKTGKFPEDAAVWVLDPVSWNRIALAHSSHGDSGPLSESTAATNYGPRKVINNVLEPTGLATLNERPAAILGASNNARMFAQRGVFTIFGKDTTPMEQQFDTNKFPLGSLTKIVIDKDKISELLTLLLRIGYTDSVSYPDLHGLAMEIKRFRGFRV